MKENLELYQLVNACRFLKGQLVFECRENTVMIAVETTKRRLAVVEVPVTDPVNVNAPLETALANLRLKLRDNIEAHIRAPLAALSALRMLIPDPESVPMLPLSMLAPGQEDAPPEIG